MAKRTQDEILVYYSQQDKAWLAHSFRTDQIGSGECILEAVESLLRGIKSIMDLAKEDPSIEVWREATADVQARAKSAKTLPYEFVEIAHRRVHGNWPKELPVQAKPSERVRFAGKMDLAKCL